MNIKAFWNRIKALLKEKDLTQNAGARACGRSLSTFKGWIYKDTIPPLDDAYALATMLGVSLEYLITGNTSTPHPQTKSKNAKIRDEVINILKAASEKLESGIH